MFPVASYMCDTLKSRRENELCDAIDVIMSVSAQLSCTGVKAVTLAAVLRLNPSVVNCTIGHTLTQMLGTLDVKFQSQIYLHQQDDVF